MSGAEMTGICPLPGRTVIAIGGRDADDFLQGLITRDMSGLTAARAVFACLLSPVGRVEADFLLVRRETGLWLDCDAGLADALLRRLGLYRLRADVSLVRETALRVAVLVPGQEGPPAGLDTLDQAGDGCVLDGGVAFRDPRHRELGIRMILSGEAPFPGLPSLPDEAWRERRLALAVPEGPVSMPPGKAFPLQHRVDAMNGVDFDKGCYVGQEVTARMKHLAEARKSLFTLGFSGPVPAPGSPVVAGDLGVGICYETAGSLALALLGLRELGKARAGGLSLTGPAGSGVLYEIREP